jgi:hypothetical protein
MKTAQLYVLCLQSSARRPQAPEPKPVQTRGKLLRGGATQPVFFRVFLQEA